MTVMAGGAIPASAAAAAIDAGVPVTTRWSGVAPLWITAAGVSGARPPASSASVVAGSVRTPMRTTSVVPEAASAA